MKRLLISCTDNLLISVTLCFLAGACLAAQFTISDLTLPLQLAGLFLFVLMALGTYLVPRQYQATTVLPFFFLVGYLHTHAALHPQLAQDDIASRIREKTKVTLIGRIVSMVEYDGDKSTLEFSAQSLLVHTAEKYKPFEPVRGTIHVTVEEPLPANIRPGLSVMALMTVQPIRAATTPGVFDYRLHMAAQGIRCAGRIGSAAELYPIAEPSQSPWQKLRHLPEQSRQDTALFLQEHLEPEVASIYQALLIGSSKLIPPQLIEMFKDNGCMHILAISGMHFSLLGLFTAFLLRQLFTRSQWLLLNTHVPTLALVLTAPLLCAYVFIAGMNIPAIRGVITALLTLLALALRRQRSMLHLVAATALVVLAVQPLALFTVSFQLSFAAVIAIITIFPRLKFFAVQEAEVETTGWRRQSLAFLQSALLVSIAATIGTLPIMLYHFNRVSLIGPVMNLIIEPLLCLWALPLGLVAFPLQWVYPDGAALQFQLGGLGIKTALLTARIAAHFPYPSLWTITPTFFEISLYFLICWLLFNPGSNRRYRLACLPLSLVLLASFTASLWEPRQEKSLQISFLDVGQGASTLLQLPNGANILIDGGGYATPRFNVGQSIIAPYLRHQRIWKLDAIILTHPHKDHYNGVPVLFTHFAPKCLIVNGDNGDEKEYSRFLNAVMATKTPVQVAQTGETLAQGPDFRLDCLSSGTNAGSWSTNDRSLVLQLQAGQHSFLFPADIGQRVEPVLIKQASSLQSEVMVAAHHGSRNANGPTLLQAVAPSIIVVSASHNRLGLLPAPEHLADWKQKKIQVMNTAELGTIVMTAEGKTLRCRTFGAAALKEEADIARFQLNNRELRQER